MIAEGSRRLGVVRRDAVFLLRRLADVHPEALSALEAAQTDTDGTVRVCAQIVLENCGALTNRVHKPQKSDL